MRTFLIILALSAAGCHRADDNAADRERRTPAYEAGRAARELAKESAKAAKAAGRELKKDAQEAHEGWKDKSREDRAKSRP